MSLRLQTERPRKFGKWSSIPKIFFDAAKESNFLFKFREMTYEAVVGVISYSQS